MPDPGALDGPVHRVCIDVGGGLHAPTQSRAIVEEVATPLDQDVREAAVLMTSELVTNSVRHGRAGVDDVIRLDVGLTDGCITVRVSDRGPGYVASAEPAARDTGGWGLVLVDRLASRWGSDDGGRSAWFEIDLPAASDSADDSPAFVGAREHAA